MEAFTARGCLEMENVILTGFMATGKSAVGQELARQLGWTFRDLDEVIEAEAGADIPALFDREGEQGFRHREKAALQRVLQDRKQVVATGGGAVMDPDNLSRMRERGVVVCLWAPPETILERAAQDNRRPLLQVDSPREQVDRLLRQRAPVYRRADLALSTAGDRPRILALRLARALGLAGSESPLRLLRVQSARGSYPVFVRPGLWEQLGPFIPAGLSRQILVVSDQTVGHIYGEQVLEKLRWAGYEPSLAQLPAGESAKKLSRVGRLYQAALRAGVDRYGAIVALGGGVVGDSAGFAAATYLRGVTLLQMPTTLLAQVDSSVGGKVGVNLPQGKNLVGAFHAPRAVLIDPHTLGTLPPRQLRAGLAEVIKAGCLFDPELLDLLEQNASRVLNLADPDLMSEIVARACHLKAGVVSRDEYEEGGDRILLNLGHTVGHALEAARGFGEDLLHGEAVSLGLLAAARLSELLGLAGPQVPERVRGLLEAFALPTHIPGSILQDALDRLIYDKKSRDGSLTFVLLRGPGEPVVSSDVPRETVERVLAELAR